MFPVSFKLQKLLKHGCKRTFCASSSLKHFSRKPPWSVLFFGSDHFSLYSLKAICKEYKSNGLLNKLEVVTNVKGKANPVRAYALEEQLTICSWPTVVEKNKYDVGLVVSFGHLIPEEVINKFPFGMLNIHASLLPRWRGAAPIIHTLANGDTETGITVMRLRPKHFDVGEIILQAKVSIPPDMTQPELHEKLGLLGAEKLVKVLKHLPQKLLHARPQPTEGVTYAPKVTLDFGKIKWETMTSKEIYNLERALTDIFPLTSMWNGIPVKLIEINIEETFCGNNNNNKNNSNIDFEKLKPGFVFYDKETKSLKVFCVDDSWISVKKIGVVGKKVMKAADFNNGYVKKEPLNKRCFS